MISEEDFLFIKDCVHTAGTMAREIQKRDLNPRRKNDQSIVTRADIEVQDFLVREISSRIGGINFIGEENSLRGGKINEDTISVIIDPVDGTAMYSMQLPVWAVSVGIFKGFAPKCGFVYSPSSDMYFYSDGCSSFLNGEKLVVDPNRIIDRETNIYYASSHPLKYDFNFAGKVRNLGSTALHACLIADNMRNRSLAFIGKSSLWDWAGAIPVLLNAGASMVYVDGTEIDYKAVVENDCTFLNDVVAYAAPDFEAIKKIIIPVIR